LYYIEVIEEALIPSTKLYKEDATTTTPIASYRLFVFNVDEVPCPQFHQKSSNGI
jgi:hypothetical protein